LYVESVKQQGKFTNKTSSRSRKYNSDMNTQQIRCREIYFSVFTSSPCSSGIRKQYSHL